MGHSLGCRTVSSCDRRRYGPPELGHRAQTTKEEALMEGVLQSLPQATWPTRCPQSPVLWQCPLPPSPPLLINHTVEVLTGLKAQLGLQPRRKCVSTHSQTPLHHCFHSANPPGVSSLFLWKIYYMTINLNDKLELCLH